MPLTLAHLPHRIYVGGAPSIAYLGSQAMNRVNGTTLAGGVWTQGASNLSIPARDRVLIGNLQHASGATFVAGWIDGISVIPRFAFAPGTFTHTTWTAEVPDDFWITLSKNAIPIFEQMSAALFADSILNLWAATGLASLNPVGTGSNSAGTGTAISADVNTVPGGIIIAGAINDVTAAQSCTWSGDQTPTEREDAAGSGFARTCAEVTNTNADAANTVTATFAASATTRLMIAAAAFR